MLRPDGAKPITGMEPRLVENAMARLVAGGLIEGDEGRKPNWLMEWPCCPTNVLTRRTAQSAPFDLGSSDRRWGPLALSFAICAS